MSVRGQAKLVLARYGAAVVVGLLLLAVAALGGAVSAYGNPPMEEVTRETDQQSIDTSVGTRAVVTNGTPLYEEGRIVRDMPVYFLRATPNLTLRIRTDVPRDQEVAVAHRLVLALRAVRGERTFFRSRRVIVAERMRVTDGVARSNATLNVSAVRAEVSEKRAAIGDVGTLRVTVRLNVSYETDRYAGTLSTTAPLSLAGSAYWLDGDMSASRTHSRTVTRRVTGRPDTALVGGLALLGIAALVGAAVVGLRYREIDADLVATRLARSRYDEWISNGEVPTKSGKEYIRTDSLADLVDVAIDSNSRVIYDRTLDAYGVVEDDLVYYFTTGDAELTDWFDV